MAKITYNPTSDTHYIQTSITGAHLVEIPLTKTDAFLTDPVNGKPVSESIQIATNSLEQRALDGEAIDRFNIEQTSGRIIDRGRTYQSIVSGANSPESGGRSYDRELANLTGTEEPNWTNATGGVNLSPNIQSGDREAYKAEESVADFWSKNKMSMKAESYQQTIGGADMSVFFLSEVPVLEDLIEGLPAEAMRKELIILEMDNVLSLQYSLIREVFPVRQMGSANPVDYTRGPRTIAGHIAFAVFAEDVLARLRSRTLESFDKLFESVTNNVEAFDLEKLQANNGHARNVSPEEANHVRDNEIAIAKAQKSAAKLYRYYDAALHFDAVQLLDQMPPFHLLIVGVNEQGVLSKFLLKNIHIIDENQLQGTRQPNVMNKVSFVARDIVPMHNADPDMNITNSMSEWAEPGSVRDKDGNSIRKGTDNTQGTYINRNYSASSALKESISQDLEI